MVSGLIEEQVLHQHCATKALHAGLICSTKSRYLIAGRCGKPLAATHIVGEMASWNRTAQFARASLLKPERDVLQPIPLLYPEGSLRLLPQTGLNDEKDVRS